MSFLSELLGDVGALVKQVGGIARPTTIPVVFPEDHFLRGQSVGTLVRKEDDTGGTGYVLEKAPRGEMTLQRAASELVVAHTFGDLSSFKAYSKRPGEADRVLFLEPSPFKPYRLTGRFEAAPEVGQVGVSFHRHPSFLRWSSTVFSSAEGGECVISHEDLADLFEDQQADLIDPKIVPFIARMRASKTLTYDGKMDDSFSQTVTAAFKVESEGATNVKIPRLFEASIPAFRGAWEQDKEPKHRALFRLRVQPPKRGDDSGVLRFRVHWVNAAQYEAEAAEALRVAVAGALSPAVVFIGSPSSTRYVVPGRPGITLSK